MENRRNRKDLFYYANGSEVDLCDGEGKMFVNTCWNLADAETFRREKAAMAFGVAQWLPVMQHSVFLTGIPHFKRKSLFGLKTESIPKDFWKSMFGNIEL